MPTSPEAAAQGSATWVLRLRALVVIMRMMSVVCVIVTIPLLVERSAPTVIVVMFGFSGLFYVRDTWRIVAKAIEHGVDYADWWRP